MYILNKNGEILDSIKEKINNFDELFISVSFITFWGIETLFSKDILNENVKVVTTTDEFITDPKAIELLLKSKCNVRLINKEDSKRGFHSKFIYVRKGNEYFSFVGSLNLTKRSLLNKYETIYTSDKKDKFLEDQFNYLYSIGKILDEEFLYKYKEKYNHFNNEHKNFLRQLEKKVNLKENEMQKEVLEELSLLRSEGKDMALLYAATGTGKTYLSAFDMKKKGFKKALFIVHSRLIIKSAMRDYSIVFRDKNLLELKSSNIKMVNNSDIVFTTQNTIMNILKKDEGWLSNFDHFIFDEAHKIGPDKSQGKIFNLIRELNKDKFIFGMTATPWRTDKKNFVINLFNKQVVGNIDLSRAIKERMVCDFKYEGLNIKEDFNREDLDKVTLESMVKEFIDSVKNKEVWDKTKVKGLIFTKNTKEADIVAKILNKDSSYNSVSVHSKANGDLSKEDKEEASIYIERLQNESNDLNFMVVVDMFNEGVDIPRINTIGMFRFTGSNIIYTQQIGRGLRKEGSNDKYLNIIDLVGNHERSHERMLGLMGKDVINPREAFEFIKKIEEFGSKYKLEAIAKKKILDSLIKNSNFYNYFNELLNYEKYYKNSIPKLSEINDKFNETIQVISNNYRSKSQLNVEDKSWVVEMYSQVTDKYDKISLIENSIIELFAWMPLTTSIPKEKEAIIKILNGENVLINDRWHQYFYGEHENTHKFITGDFRKYFDVKGSFIKFNFDKLKHKETKELLEQVKEYLIKYRHRNDHLQKNWYSKYEIAFMGGKQTRIQSSKFKSELSGEQFLMNDMEQIKYINKISGPNTQIVSMGNEKMHDDSEIYHNFMGRKLFHKNKLFYYLGRQEEKIKFNNIQSNSEGKKFATLIFKSEYRLSEKEIFLLSYI